MPVKKALYDRVFYAWSRQQFELLRKGRLADADIEHIADEIDSMRRTEKRQLNSRLSVLLLHLMKWRYKPEKRSQAGGEHPRPAQSCGRSLSGQSEPEASAAEGPRGRRVLAGVK